MIGMTNPKPQPNVTSAMTRGTTPIAFSAHKPMARNEPEAMSRPMMGKIL